MHWVLTPYCGQNPAPRKKPWNDDSPVNIHKHSGFNHGFISWCETDFATIHMSFCLFYSELIAGLNELTMIKVLCLGEIP